MTAEKLAKGKERVVLEVKDDGSIVTMSRKQEKEWRKSIKTQIRNQSAFVKEAGR